MASNNDQMIFAPSSINGLSFFKAAGLLFHWLPLGNEDDAEEVSDLYVKYTSGHTIEVLEANAAETKSGDDFHPVETLNFDELEILRKKIAKMICSSHVNQDACFDYPGTFWWLTRKELTAICFAVYRVMDIIAAINEGNFDYFLNIKAVKLIADAYYISNNTFAVILTGKSVATVIPVLAEIMSVRLSEHGDIIAPFLNTVKMVDKLIKGAIPDIFIE
jgi:hypothetical protein